MSTTTDIKKRTQPKKSRLPLIIILVQALVVGTLWLAQPYLRSHMEVNKSELDKRVQEVEKRSLERKKKEDTERKKKRLTKEDMAKLKKEVRKKSERKIRKKINEINIIRKELKEEKVKKLELAKSEDINKAFEAAHSKLQADIAQLQEQAADIDRKSKSKEASTLRAETTLLKTEADALSSETGTAIDIDIDTDTSLSALQEKIGRADATAQQLYDTQTAGEKNPNTRKRVGKKHHTQKYRDDLAAVKKDVASIADGSYADALDFKEIDQLIADPGIEINPERILAMDIEELYELAQQLEQEITQDYAAIRAAELSAIRDSDFSDSYENIASNLPKRKGFDFDAMGAKLENLGDVSDYRGELDDVAQEVHGMLQNIHNKHGQSKGFQRLGKDDKKGAQSAADAMAQLQTQQAISAAAQMQTGSSTMVDMSEQMRASYALGSSNSSGDSQGDSQRSTAEKNNTALRGVASIQKKAIRIDSRKIKAEAMPGRKFTDDSTRTGWLYLDTWYIIGPWEIKFKNGLVDWSQVHPPEYEIDLSQEYIGKKGTTLAWQFNQSSTLRIKVPNEQPEATYYAYTEVHFEKDQDMLLAIASDDAAKVWVNDILVWQDNGLSAWSLDEGFRKVAFKKGFNNILVRIANGPGLCEYSLLLCPPQ